MNCPKCTGALIQPEGGVAYCDACGWGNRDWYIRQYNLACTRVQQVMATPDPRVGELLAAIIEHKQKVKQWEAANANTEIFSAWDEKLWEQISK